MVRPASFRLPEQLLERIDEEAAERQTSVTALVTLLLDEGLKTRRFPGIVYREGPSGRRAGLLRGPDVWEVIRAIRSAPGKGEQRLRRVVSESGLSIEQVRLAVDFYAAHPTEIDERLAAAERAAQRLQQAIRQRQQLLPG